MAGLPSVGAGEIMGADRRQANGQIHAVQKGAGYARLIGLLTVGAAPTIAPACPAIPAPAGIHGRDKLEAGRVAHMKIGARNQHIPGFQRLAQTVEDIDGKFR